MLPSRVFLSLIYSGHPDLLLTWRHAISMQCAWSKLRWLAGPSTELDQSNYQTPVMPANLKQLVIRLLVLSILGQTRLQRNVSACIHSMSRPSGRCIEALPQQRARHVYCSTAC